MQFSKQFMSMTVRFIEMIASETGYSFSVFDHDGYTIYATEPGRIGNFNVYAKKVMETGVDEYAVTKEKKALHDFVDEGYLCAITYNDQKIGAFGIAGKTDIVKPVAKMARRLFLSWINEIKYQEKLNKTEKKFQLIFEHAPLGILHFNRQGEITECNTHFVNIIGSSKEVLVGLNMLTLPDKNIVSALKKALSGQSAFYEGIYHSVTAEKKTPVSILFGPVLSEDRTIEGGIGIIKDITERNKAEIKLKESENRFRELAQLLPETIFETDLTGKIQFMNQKASDLFGYSGKTFESGFNLYQLIEPKDRKQVKKQFENLMYTENTGIHEYEMQRKDGSTFPGLLNASTIYKSERVAGFRGFLIDITEKKRTQEILIQSEKMMSVGGLAAGMAHEINNPLAGMLLNAQVVINRLSKDIPANRAAAESVGTDIQTINAYMKKRDILHQLNHIKQSGHQAAKIVQNMLNFAKKRDPKKTACDLVQLIENTLELIKTDYDMEARYDFKKVKIIKKFPPGLPCIPCEETKIQQVFMNIIKNSMDAVLDDTGTLENLVLQFKLINNTKTVCIEISDNGPGMDETVRKRIFEPFFTTKSVDKGTGLGLSISYFIIVDHHKGVMEVSSTPGYGTVFSIELPVQSEA